LNGKSLGTKRKSGDELHVAWRIPFQPGLLKAVSRRNGKVELTEEIRTAEAPAKIVLSADRPIINGDGVDLSFVTVRIVDRNGTLIPNAEDLVKFDVSGEGFIAGVDNGSQISHEPFKASQRKAFHGQCLAIIQSKGSRGKITLKASASGLSPGTLVITAR